jgi:MurNAc alpha-1-phosphate uridylyltransferase
MIINRAFILAAGFGTRLRPITDTIPKALVEVAGVPQVDRLLKQLSDAGITNFSINTHYLADKMATHLQANHPDVQVLFEKEILETGGGLVNLFNNISDDYVLCVNSDAVFTSEAPFKEILAAFNPDKMDMLLMLKKWDKPADFALSEDGKIYRAEGLRDYQFTGVYIISRRSLQGLKCEKFSINKLWFLNDVKPVHPYYGIVTDQQYLDMGTIENLKRANSLCQSK